MLLHSPFVLCLSRNRTMIIREATVADAPAFARIHMDSWRNTYRGLVSDEFLDNLKFEDRLKRWQQRLSELSDTGMFAYLAETATGQAAGFAYAGPEGTGHPDYRGELWALHIALPYQKMGLGRRLISEVAKRLHDLGYGSMLVWVLAGNPARRFYEKLGGVYLTERLEAFAGGSIEEVAYGYADLMALIQERPEP